MKRRRVVWLAVLLTFLAGCNNGAWSSGDRVLVTKYLYDSDTRPPHRFDVVVFRCPDPPARGGPLDNFIKRLLGLAGETLAIFFGQIFVTTDLHIPEDLDGKHAVIAPATVDPQDLWRPDYLYKDDAVAGRLFKAGPAEAGSKTSAKKKGFEILRKPPDVMLALRRIVYDNDFPAKDLDEAHFPARWSSASPAAWSSASEHTMHYAGKGKDVEWLSYQHILRPLDWPEGKERKHRPQLITDFSGYNSYEKGGLRREFGGNWVGDLMLEFQVKVDRAEGELWLELVRGVDRFRAGWELSSGRCTLWRLQEGKQPQKLQSASTNLKQPGTYQLRFANFDQRLTLWVDRDMPFGDGVEYPRAWYYDGVKSAFVNTGPTLNDLKPASIGCKGAAVELSHLQLWRNTYYTIARPMNTACDADLPSPRQDQIRDGFSPEDQRAAAAGVAEFWEGFWSNPQEWGRLRELNFLTLYVQKGHYLCLGDNSPESHDSRAWGAVPERLMLGRALAVYYPFSRASLIR